MTDDQDFLTATVAEVLDDFTVVINRGSFHGVKLGNKYLVFARGSHIIDPDTGEDLGALEVVRGIGSVSHVQDRMCTLKSARIKSNPVFRRQNPTPFFRSESLRLLETVEETRTETVEPFEGAQTGDRARLI